jgi:murein DD-endopeptidase MepM/ murein hydrolase activator NlpD
MKEKHTSIIIIPHKKGKHRTLSLSRRTFKILRVTLLLVCVMVVLLLFDYFSMRGLRQKYNELQVENAQQKKIVAEYKESIDELESTVQDFEDYRQKLNVMAGLKSEETINEEPGLGGPGVDQESALSDHVQDLARLQEINQQAEGIQDNLLTLSKFFEDQTIILAQTPSIMPTQGYWASPFGTRTDPFTGKKAFHPGVDIATQYGNPVMATADGIVLTTKTEKIGGKTIKISHPQTGYVTVYCHLSKFMVKSGQSVKRGETIGLVGRTGRARGPHVHYEVRRDGKRLNPWRFILDN